MVIQAFRDNIPKWLTGIILVLIIGPFALWGINSYFSASGDTSVAKVNGTEISPQDFQQAYQSRYQQLQQAFGSSFKPGLIDEKQLRQEVLRQLINETLLDQQVEKQHYSVSDADLVATIQQIPVFQVDGKFSPQVYQATLASNGMTAAGFEQRERQRLSVSQLQNSIQASAFGTPQQLEIDLAVQNEQRQIAYTTVSTKQYLDQAKVSDADIADYYKSHAEQFMTPEKVTLAYVELDEAQLAKGIQASDAQLQALYEQQIASFKQDETREAQHILIAVNGNDPKADATAKAKAEDILRQLKAGADFAKLAEKYSNDPGSAKNGGDLGWIGRGSMVKPFEDALFNIPKVGDIAGPVRTQYGYHIIKLDGIRSPSTKPFSQLRDQLLAEYQKKQADNQYFALGDQLANLAYEHPDSLQTVSKQLNLPIETVDDVIRDAGSGIAANPAVRQKAFSDEVLTQGNNSDPIQIGPNHVVVIRVKGHIPSEQRPLTDVRNQIVALLKQQQAAQKAQQIAQTVEAALKSGQAIAQVSSRYDLKYTPEKFVSRTDASVPPQVLSAVFVSPRPASGVSESGTVALTDGDQVVFVLTGVKAGNVSDLSKDQIVAKLQDLTRLDANAEFAAYLENLRQHAKIKINDNNIQE
ncbi:MAG TPA: SurA N-terminal domain-containing protein [Gammaproteobacteria bacterium]|nr:SurA N-terminal domain-containing protein [Gammaproteobacteria bacterium]